MRRKWGMGLALAALAGGSGARAENGCWREAEAAAARVRQMQTMLMVATLRCRAAHVDIVASYDGFVVARGDALGAANEAIKRHFAQAGGTQADYDRFATSLANAYGDDDTSEASCAEAAALAHDAAAAGGDEGLRSVAARLFPAALPGGLCGATGATGAPPALAAADPAAPPPVVLPPDIVAALAVMARVRTAADAARPPAPTMLASAAR